jgi:acyl-CoA synthetase (AMP-forming)/AMP-acid ligase II
MQLEQSVRFIHDLPALRARSDASSAALQQADQIWTFEKWHRAIAHAASELEAAGLRPGDRLGIVGENGSVLATLIHAASRCQAWPVILNARLSARELETVLSHAEPKLTAFTTDVSPDALRHAQQRGALPVAWGELPTFQLTPPRAVAAEAVTGDPTKDVAALLYTSGTTGTPKGVMLTHQNLLYVARAATARRVQGCHSLSYISLPLSHVFGLTTLFLGTSYRGGCARLIPRFDPHQAIHELETRPITLFGGVPAAYARILDVLRARGRPLRPLALAYLVCGGSPLSASLRREVEDAFGLPLNNGYGMTELSPTVALTVAELGKADESCGLPLEELDIEIRGSEGKPVARGEIGVLHVRGPNVMRGYFKNADLSAQTIDGRGFLDTGDFARTDERGHLHIVGRAKDLIIRSGFNVYPEEVEAVLREHPSVTLAGVVGRQAGDNEEVIAFVQLAPGATLADGELETWCSSRLAPYKRPARYVQLDALPASSAGKVLKAPLRAMVQAS